jgi:hypothetical protein
MKKIILTTLTFTLMACAPKYSFVKTKFDNEAPQIENILFVLDYVSLKDDVGELWDFDENKNIKNMDKMYSQIENILKSKGYNVLKSNLKASGLLINDEYQAEHYLDKKLQEDLISPPFLIRSNDINEENINNLRILNFDVRNHLAGQISSKIKNLGYGQLPSLDQLNMLDLPANTAIVVVNSNRPKVSAIKAIGVGVMSAALTGGYLFLSSHGVPSTFGYMVHADTGDILWSNYGPAVNFANNPKFMKDFPAKIAN